MQQQFWLSYETDFGYECQINIKYDDSTAEQRLAIGGFTPSTVAQCNWSILRKDLEPRTIILRDLGQVYFQNYQKWLDFIKDSANTENIKKVSGERLNARLLTIGLMGI